jgi:hypothetical protein
VIAILGSVAVALAGLYLLLAQDSADLAVFGWVFVVLGTVGAVLNLLMRARTRRAQIPREPGRQ